MPGFVDVSGMTYEDVRRMGHADDYDEEPQYRGSRAPARTNPVLQVGFPVSDVWAAACAAQRVNGEYLKEGRNNYDDKGQVLSTTRRNRDIMLEFLHNPSNLTVDDVEQGEAVRKWLQHDLTFRALKSGLTDFDQATQKCLAVQDRFYTVGQRYELAVVAALPNVYAKAKSREATQDRIATTSGELIGSVGDKIQLNVEVIRTVFSKTWNIWFATVVTSDNHAVFFSHKNPLTVGHFLTIKGTVKAHKDGQTQLNRVSII
jgi:hypothetical protein